MISRVHEIEKEVDGLMHDSKVIKCCYRDKKEVLYKIKIQQVLKYCHALLYLFKYRNFYRTLHSWTYQYIILFQLLYFSDDWCKGKQCLQ